MATARMAPPAGAVPGSVPNAAAGHAFMQSPPQQQGMLAPGTRIMVGAIVVTVQKYLSQGGFAHVYLVTTDKPIPVPVSTTSAPGATSSTTRGETLHVLKRMAVPDKEALASVRGEVEVHKSLRSHPNIVHFVEASATALRGGGYEVFILMEYCSGGGIIDLMNARLRTRLTEAEVLKIFGDVAAGLSVMHEMDPPLMHRDLKVENILLAPPPRNNPSVGPTYKLCDFGSAKPLLSRKAARSLEEVKRVEADLNMHTTLQYRAPEMVDVYQRRVIDEKADIWAMGVLLYKLCYYTTPFEENGGGPLAILNARYRFPPMPPYSQRLKDLIASMLQEKSTLRPSIDEVLVRVHRMLGTQPPSSALSRVKTINGSTPLPHVPPPASVSSPRSETFQGPAGGVDADLLQAAPSQTDMKRAEEEEKRRRSEGITPMRRGRPNRGPAATAAVAKFEANSSSSTGPGYPSKPSTATSAYIPSSSPPMGAFADSFAPDQPANGSAATLDVRKQTASLLDHSPALPGFDASSLNNSARASPLPPAVASPPPMAKATVASPPPTLPSTMPKFGASVPTTTPKQDDDATDRFPSVEELDRRYPTKPPAERSPTLPASGVNAQTQLQSGSSFAASRVPGLSDRASVSSMAGRFGAMATKRASAPVPMKPSLSLTSSSSSKPNAGSLASRRWPHDSSRPESPEQSTSVRSPPALPSRKHDWIKEDSKGRKATSSPDLYAGQNEKASSKTDSSRFASLPPAPKEVVEEDDGSSGEDEQTAPEDLDAPRRSSSRPSQMDPDTFRQRQQVANGIKSSAETQQQQADKPLPGRVKPPSWAQAPSAAIQNAKPAAAVLPASKTDDSASTAGPAPASNPTSPHEDLLSSPQISAKAPAWDDDDEEMHFLPQPTFGSQAGSAISPLAAQNSEGMLIDYGQQSNEAQFKALTAQSATMPRKQYADASTSPRETTPDVAERTFVSPSLSQKPAFPAPLSQQVAAATAAPKAPLSPKPVVAPKPSRLASNRDIGGLVSRFEDAGLESGSSTSKASKPTPPVKPGNIRSRQEVFEAKKNGIPASASADSIEQKRAENPSTEKQTLPPPAITSKKPSLAVKPPAKEDSATKLPPNRSTLKPWEREALEKEQVHKFGSLRTHSPTRVTGGKDDEDGDSDDSMKKSPISINEEEVAPTLSKGGGSTGAGNGRNPEAQDRFRGVSSLISQWQSNASRGAPGWGLVGGVVDAVDAVGHGIGHGISSHIPHHLPHGSSSKATPTSPTKQRMTISKDEDDVFRHPSHSRGASGDHSIKGRITSREV